MLFKKDFNRFIRLAIGLIVFLIIAVPVAARSSFVQFLDDTFAGIITKFSTTFFDDFYGFLSMIASPKAGLVWILLIAFLLWGFKYKIQALWALGTVVGGDILDQIVKFLIGRPRPVGHPLTLTGYSFPSGHVMSTFLIISVLWFVVIPFIKDEKKQSYAQIACWVFVGLVMLARIYLKAHYPSDTLGALALGYSWLQISQFLYVRYAPQLKKYHLTHHSYI